MQLAARRRGAPGLMLHIGCGASRIDQFVNIDCRATPTTDHVAPAWDLSAFPAGGVEYIYSRHMLEHLSIKDAARSLREWHRVLCAGGIVHVVVPNLLFHARQLLGLATCPVIEDQRAHALAGFYGWQSNNDGHGDLHRWGYTPDSLERLMRAAASFEITDDGIEQLTTRDCEPWHINMRAVKGFSNAVA